MLVSIWRKRDLHPLLMEMQFGATTVENSMEVPQNLKMKLSYCPAIPLLSIAEETKTTNSEDDLHPYDYCSNIYNGQDTQECRCPSRGLDETVVVHIHSEILLIHEKE